MRDEQQCRGSLLAGPRRASDPSTGAAAGDGRSDHDEDRRDDDADDPSNPVDALRRLHAQRGGDVVRAWFFIVLLTVGYLLSRGIAKSGSRDYYDAR
jgi:hypothetical protein